MNKLISFFNNDLDIKKEFNHLSYKASKYLILNTNKNFIILLGQEGVGKSFLLNSLSYSNNFYPFFYSHNYEKEILDFFGKDLKNKKIAFDMGGVFDLVAINFLYNLSQKNNKIVVAIEEKLFKKKVFNKEFMEIIYLNSLSFEDFRRYILYVFTKFDKYELLVEKELKKIYKFTKGNIRKINEVFFTCLNLLNYSLQNNLKYDKLNSCIIEMGLIKLGKKWIF